MRITLRCHYLNMVLIALNWNVHSWEICQLRKSFMSCEHISHIAADDKCQLKSHWLCCLWVNSWMLEKLWIVTHVILISIWLVSQHRFPGVLLEIKSLKWLEICDLQATYPIYYSNAMVVQWKGPLWWHSIAKTVNDCQMKWTTLSGIVSKGPRNFKTFHKWGPNLRNISTEFHWFCFRWGIFTFSL